MPFLSQINHEPWASRQLSGVQPGRLPPECRGPRAGGIPLLHEGQLAKCSHLPVTGQLTNMIGTEYYSKRDLVKYILLRIILKIIYSIMTQSSCLPLEWVNWLQVNECKAHPLDLKTISWSHRDEHSPLLTLIMNYLTSLFNKGNVFISLLFVASDMCVTCCLREAQHLNTLSMFHKGHLIRTTLETSLFS